MGVPLNVDDGILLRAERYVRHVFASLGLPETPSPRSKTMADHPLLSKFNINLRPIETSTTSPRHLPGTLPHLQFSISNCLKLQTTQVYSGRFYDWSPKVNIFRFYDDPTLTTIKTYPRTKGKYYSKRRNQKPTLHV